MRNTISVLVDTLLSMSRVILRSKFSHKSANSQLRVDTCFVLGNGPSLDGDLAQCKDFRSIGDVWCVNQFAVSDLYEKLQPTHYVLADPAYWSESLSEHLTALRDRLFLALKSKTTWPLTLYLPYFAKGCFEEKLADTLNITVAYYNNVPVFGCKRLAYFLYNRGLGMPLAQNVLVAALYLSLHRGYKKIFVLGADHSWHRTLEVDNLNRVCVQDRHFYDKEEPKLIPFLIDGSEESTFTMAGILSALARMFDGYWKLKEYSESIGAVIYNASSISYIDAFKRIKPAEISIASEKSS